MNKYIGMVILKPDIEKGQIDFIQSDIINLFKQNAKVQMVWHLGKRNLDYKIKKYTEGLYLKLEILAKAKKIEQIKEQLKRNENVIFSIVMNNESQNNKLPILKRHPLPFHKVPQVNKLETPTEQNNKVYMLINKNIKLPFAESDIIGISTNIQNIFQHASKKINEYVFVKGYFTTKKFKNIKDLENDFKRTWKVEFVLGDNQNVGQQLLIQEKYLI